MGVNFTPNSVMTKYIFVSGGVISGIGKGVAAASIAFLLKSYGYKVTIMKADPYVNIDAGTMNPLEHGETFVLEDGLETDLDLGHYERFTGETFTEHNSVTSGKIFKYTIDKERSLGYHGKWISIDHHVIMEMVYWTERLAKEKNADFVIVEIGGTVGELGNSLFLEFNRRMQLEHPGDVIHIHLSYLPVPNNLGEMKSKPAQLSVRLLNACGVQPDFLIARSVGGIDEIRRDKLSTFCYVPLDNVISAPDVKNIYEIPINFERDRITEKILKTFGLKCKRNNLYNKWEKLTKSIPKIKKHVKIGVVSKYFKSGNFDLKDSYVSVEEAIKHAFWSIGAWADIKWIVSDGLENDKARAEKLKELDGIIVPQGWGSRGVEGKIAAVKVARETLIPYLGLCFGMQMATIEYARDVLNFVDANSEEVNPDSKYQVIHLMNSQKENIKNKNYGGTIRLGAWPCKVKKGSLLEKCYKDNKSELYKNLPLIQERHRHRYEFNNEYREEFEKKGFIISGESPDGKLVEAIELDRKLHPFFVGTQYHPEYKSQFLNPHPIFVEFAKATVTHSKKLIRNNYVAK